MVGDRPYIGIPRICFLGVLVIHGGPTVAYLGHSVAYMGSYSNIHGGHIVTYMGVI